VLNLFLTGAPTGTAEGVPADGVTMEQAVALMRGPEGSSTHLTVARPSGPPVRMELERRRLPQPAVRVRSPSRLEAQPTSPQRVAVPCPHAQTRVNPVLLECHFQ
jgi:C-terminal processing protease CtpA/Prc